MASHGTDQLIVQRLLSARSLKDAQRAIIGSGIAVFVQFALFLTVGLGLWALYGGAHLRDARRDLPDVHPRADAARPARPHRRGDRRGHDEHALGRHQLARGGDDDGHLGPAHGPRAGRSRRRTARDGCSRWRGAWCSPAARCSTPRAARPWWSSRSRSRRSRTARCSARSSSGSTTPARGSATRSSGCRSGSRSMAVVVFAKQLAAAFPAVAARARPLRERRLALVRADRHDDHAVRRHALGDADPRHHGSPDDVVPALARMEARRLGGAPRVAAARASARDAILSEMNAAKPVADLNACEFKVFSQFGEDGIIQRLVRHLPIAHRTFIEFGVENFAESNCRFLMMNDNWRGFVMDGSAKRIGRDSQAARHLEVRPRRQGGVRDARERGRTARVERLRPGPGDSLDRRRRQRLLDSRGRSRWSGLALLIVEYNALFGPERATSRCHTIRAFREVRRAPVRDCISARRSARWRFRGVPQGILARRDRELGSQRVLRANRPARRRPRRAHRRRIVPRHERAAESRCRREARLSRSPRPGGGDPRDSRR